MGGAIAWGMLGRSSGQVRVGGRVPDGGSSGASRYFGMIPLLSKPIVAFHGVNIASIFPKGRRRTREGLRGLSPMPCNALQS